MPIFSKIIAYFRPPHRLLLLFIFLIGLSLRLYQINYGLPERYLPDENYFVHPAINVANGQLDPKWYGAPAHLLIYLLALVFRLLNFILNFFYHSNLPTHANYPAYLAIFQTFGRLIPVIAGTASIILIYLIGRHWHRRVGLWAAALTATSFFLVYHSHIIRPDIIQVLFLLAAVLFLFQIFDKPSKIWPYIGLGLAFGFAVSCKYPSLFFIIPVLTGAIILLIKEKFFLTRWLTATISSLIAAFISGPFLFLKFERVLFHLGVENRTEHAGHDGLGFWGNYKWYLIDTLHWQAGTFLFLLALTAIGLIIFRLVRKNTQPKYLKYLVVIFFLFSYPLCLSYLSLHWERWLIPSLIFVFLFSALGLDWLWQRLRRKPLFLAVILIFFFAAPLLRLVRIVYGFSQPYPIAQAQDWIIDNLPPYSVIIAEPYTPTNLPGEYVVLDTPNLTYFDLPDMEEKKASFYMISGDIYGRISEKAAQSNNPGFVKATENYHRDFARDQLIYYVRPHPTLEIDELIEGHDLKIIKNPSPKFLLGSAVEIFQINYNNTCSHQ